MTIATYFKMYRKLYDYSGFAKDSDWSGVDTKKKELDGKVNNGTLKEEDVRDFVKTYMEKHGEFLWLSYVNHYLETLDEHIDFTLCEKCKSEVYIIGRTRTTDEYAIECGCGVDIINGYDLREKQLKTLKWIKDLKSTTPTSS